MISGATGYRLPTDDEWTWSAHGGQQTDHSGGNEPGPVAWTAENSNKRTHVGCTRDPNAWGLCDMSGNVWEWTWDPPGGAGSNRMVRGGSWYSNVFGARVAYRNDYAAGHRWASVGFRLSRSE